MKGDRRLVPRPDHHVCGWSGYDKKGEARCLSDYYHGWRGTTYDRHGKVYHRAFMPRGCGAVLRREVTASAPAAPVGPPLTSVGPRDGGSVPGAARPPRAAPRGSVAPPVKRGGHPGAPGTPARRLTAAGP